MKLKKIRPLLPPTTVKEDNQLEPSQERRDGMNLNGGEMDHATTVLAGLR
jgi:hypothetical protein